MLTPVDWHGYLQQQRRWARSVIDLKLRWYPRLFRSLSGRARVAAGLHGLYYLGGLAVPLVLAYLCYLLPSGQQPLAQGFSSIPLAVILSVLIICDFYRQRFYLRPRLEWGLHWRAMILKYAKWPWLVVALFDAISASPDGFEVTAKKKVYARRAVTIPVRQLDRLGRLPSERSLHFSPSGLRGSVPAPPRVAPATERV